MGIFGDLFGGESSSAYYSYVDSYGTRSGGYHHHEPCCPLVVDPLTLTAILGAIAAATAFFNVLITMNISGGRRRKRNLNSVLEDVARAGEIKMHLTPLIVAKITDESCMRRYFCNTVDSAHNIHGYKGQPVIVATKIMSQNPH